MKKTISYILVGLTLTVGLLASCSGNKKSKDGRTDTYSSGAISFVSDESFSPIISEEIAVFQATYPKAKVTPIYTSESEGINRLLNLKAWLVFTARDFKAKERQNLIDRGYRPATVKVGYDALALIVNKANTDTLISVQNIRDIMSGKITRWDQIYKGSKRGVIDIVFDNPKSSTIHYVEDSILGGKPLTNPNVSAVEKTAEVIKYVEKTPNAIGIIGNNWLNDKRDTTNLTFNRDIRVMSVSKTDPAKPLGSYKPYQYYIYTGNYPLIRTIYALLNDPRQGLPWGFAHFVESPKGQLIIMKAGLLPMYGNINIRDVNISQ